MLLMGVLYIVLGLLFVRQPIQAAEALTLLLACTLMVSGVFRIAGSLMHRFRNGAGSSSAASSTSLWAS